VSVRAATMLGCQHDRAEMNPLEFFQAGKLGEAIAALGDTLRRNPTDDKSRTFLFELLCFSGEYDRAEKHLDVLAQNGVQPEMGAMLYRGAIYATKIREDLFRDGKISRSAALTESSEGIEGTLNGTPFHTLVDADSRVGANLEVFAAGNYLLIPYSVLASVEITPPRRLRDLLWIPAVIRTKPDYKDRELGETLLPALTPFSSKNENDAVRLGRETAWEECEAGEVFPVGQKILLADDEEMPILDLRKLEFTVAQGAS